MRFVLLLVLAALAGCVEDSDPVDAETADRDGDGFTDAAETAAGTDPDDPDSFPAPVRTEEPISFSGSGLIVMGNEGLGVGPECGGVLPDPVPDSVSFTWSIQAPSNATDAQVRDLSFTATYPATMPEGDIYVYDPDGNLLSETTTFPLPPPAATSFEDTVTIEGLHKPGDWRIDVRGCLGAGEISLAGSATLSYG